VPRFFQNVPKFNSPRLSRTPLYPTFFDITSLRELKLTGYAGLFHFGTFVGFLGSNLGLESIVLSVKSVETAPERKVALARLQHLSITCSKTIDSRGLLSPDPASFLPSPPTPIQELLAPITTIRSQRSPWEVYLSGNNPVSSFRCTKPQS